MSDFIEVEQYQIPAYLANSILFYDFFVLQRKKTIKIHRKYILQESIIKSKTQMNAYLDIISYWICNEIPLFIIKGFFSLSEPDKQCAINNKNDIFFNIIYSLHLYLSDYQLNETNNNDIFKSLLSLNFHIDKLMELKIYFNEKDFCILLKYICSLCKNDKIFTYLVIKTNCKYFTLKAFSFKKIIKSIDKYELYNHRLDRNRFFCSTSFTIQFCNDFARYVISRTNNSKFLLYAKDLVNIDMLLNAINFNSLKILMQIKFIIGNRKMFLNKAKFEEINNKSINLRCKNFALNNLVLYMPLL